jgi:hypothetical protein
MSGHPTVYARVINDSNNPQNPTGLAYYDSSLPTNERFSSSLDIYVATSEIVYSAGYRSS